METSISFFIIGILLSIIAWLGRRILTEILAEIKQIRREVDRLTENHVKARAMIQNLPCRTEIKPCLHLQGIK